MFSISLMLFIKLTIGTYQPPDSCRYIYWNDDLEIGVEAFKGLTGSIPFDNEGFKAVSKTEIIIKTYSSDDTIGFKVINRFDQEESWIADKTGISSTLLSHERFHFNISEVYARKIRKYLNDWVHNCEDYSSTGYMNGVNMLFEERNKRQHKYDLETGHGTNYEQQKKWESTVISELNILSDFKSDVGKCLE